MGQKMGYRSLEWNWPKEAMNIPRWAEIVDGIKIICKVLYSFFAFVLHQSRSLTVGGIGLFLNAY